MRLLAGSYVAVSVVGAIHACRQGRTARFAGVRLPGTAVQHALTIGSPLSAPPILHVAMLRVVQGDHAEARLRTWMRRLGALFLVGIAGEPDSWSALRRPADDPLSAVCVLLDVALPVAMIRGDP